MGKFDFRFQSVLNVKEILQKKIEEEISLIAKEKKDLRHQLALLLEERKKVLQKITGHTMKASEYQSVKMYDSHLEKEMLSIEKKIENCEKRKQQKLKELVERKKEKKAFEIIKENDRENFMIEDGHKELKGLNEIAIRNYREKQS